MSADDLAEDDPDLSSRSQAPATLPASSGPASDEFGGQLQDDRVGDNNFIEREQVEVEASNPVLGTFRFLGPAKTASLIIAFLGVVAGGLIMLQSLVPGLLVMVMTLLIALAWRKTSGP